ncbi:MAG: SHOCT domain-containing protein [Candidatus Thermoplasmatota archaeon]
MEAERDGGIGDYWWIILIIIVVLVVVVLLAMMMRKRKPAVEVPVAEPEEHPMAPSDLRERMGRLAELRDKGLITAEDFEAKKREMLREL